MTTQPEIKAGQRWRYKKGADITVVLFCDDNSVFFETSGSSRGFFCPVYFRSNFEIITEPKPRPITKDDVLKMLAVNPVLFYIGEHGADWEILKSPSDLPDYMYNTLFSHNPFAPNAVIVGPTVTDEVGE